MLRPRRSNCGPITGQYGEPLIIPRYVVASAVSLRQKGYPAFQSGGRNVALNAGVNVLRQKVPEYIDECLKISSGRYLSVIPVREAAIPDWRSCVIPGRVQVREFVLPGDVPATGAAETSITIGPCSDRKCNLRHDRGTPAGCSIYPSSSDCVSGESIHSRRLLNV